MLRVAFSHIGITLSKTNPANRSCLPADTFDSNARQRVRVGLGLGRAWIGGGNPTLTGY
ncbi:MAG TPA: hypothetical protein PKM73_05990 [Verrucomicrobiota bacterium]|nr:hypothetical protein [Verrucomicrobiota bacterium]HNU50462.1 hypothetical protein [Verrucomicrobiota bacterium]